jgi:hypothetical protein
MIAAIGAFGYARRLRPFSCWLTYEQGLLTYSIEVPPVPDEQRLKGAFTTQPRPRV